MTVGRGSRPSKLVNKHVFPIKSFHSLELCAESWQKKGERTVKKLPQLLTFISRRKKKGLAQQAYSRLCRYLIFI